MCGMNLACEICGLHFVENASNKGYGVNTVSRVKEESTVIYVLLRLLKTYIQ